MDGICLWGFVGVGRGDNGGGDGGEVVCGCSFVDGDGEVDM